MDVHFPPSQFQSCLVKWVRGSQGTRGLLRDGYRLTINHVCPLGVWRSLVYADMHCIWGRKGFHRHGCRLPSIIIDATKIHSLFLVLVVQRQLSFLLWKLLWRLRVTLFKVWGSARCHWIPQSCNEQMVWPSSSKCSFHVYELTTSWPKLYPGCQENLQFGGRSTGNIVKAMVTTPNYTKTVVRQPSEVKEVSAWVE